MNAKKVNKSWEFLAGKPLWVGGLLGANEPDSTERGEMLYRVKATAILFAKFQQASPGTKRKNENLGRCWAEQWRIWETLDDKIGKFEELNWADENFKRDESERSQNWVRIEKLQEIDKQITWI